jgi:hypothetical protein
LKTEIDVLASTFLALVSEALRTGEGSYLSEALEAFGSPEALRLAVESGEEGKIREALSAIR